MITRQPKRRRHSGEGVYYPGGVESLLGISPPTRWRWERSGKLPKRDFFLGGSAIGWHRATIEAMGVKESAA